MYRQLELRMREEARTFEKEIVISSVAALDSKLSRSLLRRKDLRGRSERRDANDTSSSRVRSFSEIVSPAFSMTVRATHLE